MKNNGILPISALGIIGAVYSLLGGIFVVLGICLGIALRHTEAMMVGIIFSGIGAVFLILGLVFLGIIAARRANQRRLVEQGRFIWGEVIECSLNYNVRIRRGHPYYLTVRCRDAAGRTHIFHSDSLRLYPDPSLIGKQVKVYISDDSFRHYYVDAAGILPVFIEH